MIFKVLDIKTFFFDIFTIVEKKGENEVDLQLRGPWTTSLTWVILANI
jgi:hypothetical protein